MKRKLLYFAGLILITCTFKACDLLGENCQICHLVSYENGNLISEENEAEYCNETLLAIKATPPATTGGVTTQWECY
jgi:hypothetical protein